MILACGPQCSKWQYIATYLFTVVNFVRTYVWRIFYSVVCVWTEWMPFFALFFHLHNNSRVVLLCTNRFVAKNSRYDSLILLSAQVYVFVFVCVLCITNDATAATPKVKIKIQMNEAECRIRRSEPKKASTQITRTKYWAYYTHYTVHTLVHTQNENKKKMIFTNREMLKFLHRVFFSLLNSFAVYDAYGDHLAASRLHDQNDADNNNGSAIFYYYYYFFFVFPFAIWIIIIIFAWL